MSYPQPSQPPQAKPGMSREARTAVIWGVCGGLFLFVMAIVLIGLQAFKPSAPSQVASSVPQNPAQQLQADGFTVTSSGQLPNPMFGCTQYALSDPQNTGYGQAVYKCSDVQIAELNLQGVYRNGFIITTGQLPQGY